MSHISLTKPSQVGALPNSSCSNRKPPKPRKPKKGCEIAQSSFRPHILARDRLHHWTAPISDTFHSKLVKDFALDDIIQLFNVLLVSSHRMPASDNLLALFVAFWAGKTAATMVENWLSGLHFWHNMHSAPWYGHTLLHMSTAGVKKLVPESSKCPQRPPVTLEHMHALYPHLDLSNTFDASVFAVASIAFWSCCRLGELIVNWITRRSPANGVSWSSFPIPWSKTTLGTGAKIILSRVDDISNPVSALNHHISANTIVPPHAPLFAFETASGRWAPMTPGLLQLTGHCFRIGGATELLLRGVPPDVVAVQGCWKSRAFLEHWRKIDSILPLFITSSFADVRVTMVQLSMGSFNCH
ncbi:DNA breaking-rejoining enzyme [Suillus variegatus]|nr:DNA breaking-rejoining enzyme [Suillus variegatus]